MKARRANGATQDAVDRRNAVFWDELCGSGLARQLGIVSSDANALHRYDAGFLAMYPYLSSYVPDRLDGVEVLEVGLGYGTLSQMLLDRGAEYHGLDIAPGPVAMVTERMRLLGQDHPESRVSVGSVLDLPFADDAFDRVYTVGCLHHTGDLPRAVEEVHRVLRSSGTAVVMLYNARSFRQLTRVPAARVRLALARHGRHDQGSFGEEVRAMYDTNEVGEAAPHTDYTSVRVAKGLFGRFASVEIEKQNFDTFHLLRGRLILRREWFLGNVAHVLGLDLYITATK
jgi:SAM-dependent methyltransferase